MWWLLLLFLGDVFDDDQVIDVELDLPLPKDQRGRASSGGASSASSAGGVILSQLPPAERASELEVAEHAWRNGITSTKADPARGASGWQVIPPKRARWVFTEPGHAWSGSRFRLYAEDAGAHYYDIEYPPLRALALFTALKVRRRKGKWRSQMLDNYIGAGRGLEAAVDDLKKGTVEAFTFRWGKMVKSYARAVEKAVAEARTQKELGRIYLRELSRLSLAAIVAHPANEPLTGGLTASAFGDVPPAWYAERWPCDLAPEQGAINRTFERRLQQGACWPWLWLPM